jgi:dienelactone hydrolase
MPHAAVPLPQSLLFDAAGHTCVAWWHAPVTATDLRAAPALPRGWLPGGALPLAVVLASSWGEEDMSGYDGLRTLAVSLAASGLGTLRFEWPDTGDSSADTGKTSPTDALAAFDAAATQARALSGCDRLAFVGLRLGALLAAQVAQSRDDVDALVGLMPAASGRSFTREQRLLGAGVPAPNPAPRPGASFDAADLPVALGGFTQSVRGLEALGSRRGPTDAYPSLRDALLLWPAGAPGRAAADALVQADVCVHEWTHERLADALVVAHEARLDPAAVAEIVRWLQERAGAPVDGAAAARLESATGAVLALSAAGARTWMRLQVDGVAVRERFAHIGDPRDREPPLLVGVLGERDVPAATQATRAPRRGVLLLSAGGERRIGPHRLWVSWARRRAAMGDVVLRLDVAGIGDSAARAQGDPQRRPAHYDARCADDIARAVAWLRREHDVAHCTVMGLCSGAYHAWQAVLAGDDVQHVVAINPLLFHWRTGMSLEPAASPFGQIAIAEGAARALVDPARWRKLLSGRAHVGVIGRAVAARARHALRLRARGIARSLHVPLEHDLAAELVGVCERGVKLDFVFSCHEPGLTLLREEAGRRGMRLARDSRVNISVIPQADHTFAGTAGRAALYACLDSLLPSATSMIPVPTVSPSRSAATAKS